MIRYFCPITQSLSKKSSQFSSSHLPQSHFLHLSSFSVKLLFSLDFAWKTTETTLLNSCWKNRTEAENTAGFCSNGRNEVVYMGRDGGTGAALQLDSLWFEHKRRHKGAKTEITSHQHSSLQRDYLRAPQQQHLLSVSTVLPTAAFLNQTHSEKTPWLVIVIEGGARWHDICVVMH